MAPAPAREPSTPSIQAEPAPPTPAASKHPANPRPTCKAITRSGDPCSAAAGPNGFCSFHDPERADAMAESRAAGGRARSKPAAAVDADAPDLPVAKASDIVALIGDTIARVRKGSLDPRIANTIGYLSSVALRGIEVGELEERLARLESVMDSRSAGHGPRAFDRRIGLNHTTEGEHE
jgi:hypothetical protein